MGNNPSWFKGENNPVEQVSWEEAQEFIKRLTHRVKGEPYRLPTEAQWEYAARAGSTTRYCFGNDKAWLGDYVWYDDNSGSKTHPVGEKLPNNFGLHDMHGNIWEWCQDWYDHDYYTKSPVLDPRGPSSGGGRVYRGGGWFDNAGNCRSGYRSGRSPLAARRSPGGRSFALGLRLLRIL